MSPTFFPTQNDFRTWLEDNSENETELVVGFYKVNSGKASMTWSESVDQALCFGWIDGVRKSLNQEAYSIRFTPRKKNSIWSAINIDKMEQLIQKGLMTETGLLAYSFRTANKSKIYSHEKEPEVLTEEFELKSNLEVEEKVSKKPSLGMCILKMHIKNILMASTLVITNDLLDLTGPLILK